jgi:hypothetical protein
MRNTFYGSLGGSFAGSGTRLFRGGFLIWLLTVGPLVAALAGGVAAVDWSPLADALEGDELPAALEALKDDDGIKLGIGLLLSGAMVSTVIGSLLYPAYQAIVMRWWIGGLRLGGAAAASDLRIGRYYMTYLIYIAYVLLFSIAFFMVAGLALGLGYMTLRGQIDSVPPGLGEGLAAAVGIVGYVIYILGTYTIYQVVVKMSLWRAAVESMLISGYAAFDHVRANEAV